MRNRSSNKLCCIVGNRKMVGESYYYCTCEFRYCLSCFSQLYSGKGSDLLAGFNQLLDAHYEFDPSCNYNLYLRNKLEGNESQTENEASQK